MQDTPTTTTTRPSGDAGAALAAMYLGFFLVVVGGYFHLAGFDRPRQPTLPPPPSAASGFLPQFGENIPFTPAPMAPPTFLQSCTYFLAEDSASTKWIFILGCLITIWGLWRLQRLRPASAGDNGNYLQSTFRDGINPLTLHTAEDLDIIRGEVAELHQRKVLWSLPFWVTTLILLFVNEGTLGNPTFLGISDLWLMGITLACFIIFTCVYWRCPACDGKLPRYQNRFTCDKCGLQLTSPNVTYSGRRKGLPEPHETQTIAEIEEGAISRLSDSA